MARSRPDDDRFTLRQLEIFQAVVQSGGVRAAADRLGISQPSVSLTLDKLERALGISLVTRKGWRALPTAEGMEIVQYAESAIKSFHELQFKAAQMRGYASGQLHVGTGQAIGTHVITEYLGRFKRQFDGKVLIKLSVANQANLIRGVHEGDIDVVVLGDPLPPDLESHPIHSSMFYIVAPSSHPMAGKMGLTIPQLTHETLIVRERGDWSREFIEDHPQEFDDFDDRIEIAYNEAIKNAVEHGLGIALLTDTACQRELVEKRLSTLDVLGLPIPVRTSLCWKREGSSALARLFVRYMASQL